MTIDNFIEKIEARYAEVSDTEPDGPEDYNYRQAYSEALLWVLKIAGNGLE